AWPAWSARPSARTKPWPTPAPACAACSAACWRRRRSRSGRCPTTMRSPATRKLDTKMNGARRVASHRPTLRFLHDVLTAPGARQMKAIPHASRLRHLVLATACALALLAMPALAETMAALVHKARVEVHAAPDFGSPSVATLERDAELQVAGQQGLWFKV